ncbi:MAG: glycosyltransferase family 2 protein [Euryarchaeota archaeon]|nr:glycosyltransferase family 2 protein [Euryarchaeota archaeon]
MARVLAVVPVAPFEELPVLERSLACLRALDGGPRILYVIDSKNPQNDARAAWLREHGAETLVRGEARGRRAGAINDSLRVAGDAEYIAIFDVDSRPDPNFLTECLAQLEKHPEAFMASGPRIVTNPLESYTTRMVEAEYKVLTDLYRILDRGRCFKLFNGLIGVVRRPALEECPLDEGLHCEDVDFIQRHYARGRIAKYSKGTRVGEQAPLSLRELYGQRVRWISGALEGWSNLRPILRGPGSRRIKATAVTLLLMPVVIGLYGFAVPLYADKFWRARRSTPEFFLKFFGLVPYLWFLEVCALAALGRKITRRRVKWGATRRSSV